jgi:hypothetical protein
MSVGAVAMSLSTIIVAEMHNYCTEFKYDLGSDYQNCEFEYLHL